MAAQPPLFSRQRAIRAGIATTIVGFLIAFAILPAPALKLMPACTFHKLTGLPCALCGGTRSARMLLHGDLAMALYLNPVALLAIGLLLVFAVILLWEAIRGRPLTDWSIIQRKAKVWAPALLALFVVWWVPHIYTAVKEPKPELVNLNNPIAASLYRILHKSD